VIFGKVWVVAIVAARMNEVSIGIGFELYTYSIDKLEMRSDILPELFYCAIDAATLMKASASPWGWPLVT
jgi:hypothetical protein